MTGTVPAGDVASEVLMCDQVEQSRRARAAKTLAASSGIARATVYKYISDLKTDECGVHR